MKLFEVPPWVVGVAGIAIGIAIALRLFLHAGMDPTVFLAFGQDSIVHTAYAEQQLGHVVTRERAGHDGKFFFIQANDPWYLDPEHHAAFLDRPIYRARRMMFPMIAGGFGLFVPSVIVWSMVMLNIASLGIGAWLAARIATFEGVSAWLGLSVPLNIGLHFELHIGGAGIVAFVWCVGAVYALVRGRTWWAASLLALAALTREVMLAFALGLFVFWFLEHRERLWRLLIVPVGAMAVWGAYLWIRLDDVPGVGGGPDAFSPPLVGLIDGVRTWVAHPGRLLTNAVLLIAVIVFVPLAVRSREPLAWGALPFVGLSAVLSVNVWAESFDFARALVPVYTAIPFLILGRRSAPIDEDARRERWTQRSFAS